MGNARLRKRMKALGAAAIFCAALLLAVRWLLPESAASGAGTGLPAVAAPSAPVIPAVHKAQLPDKVLLYDRWRTFTTKDGLPSDETKCVRVDGDRVWVGTTEGLACYENGRWRSYGVKDGLPHRVVLALDVSPETGDLWVGTAGGLSRFSGGQFENFNQMNCGLVNDLVYGISCMGTDVWVATASGVSRYNTRTREWAIFNHNNTIMFEPWCYAISAKDDMVYVGVWGGGVVEYSLKTGYWKDYHDPDGELEITLIKDAGVAHEVIPAVSYEEGMLWAGSYFGLSTYDGRHWKNYFKTDSGLTSDFINFVRARGKVGWVCTDDGLNSFDGTTWATYRKVGRGGEMRVVRGAKLVEKRPLTAGLANNYVNGVDFQGDDVWVATLGGVSLGRSGK
jgi:ligand-binding sensor domain-containing protein